MCLPESIIPSYLSKVTPFHVEGNGVSLILAVNGLLSPGASEVLTGLEGWVTPCKWLACGTLDTSTWDGWGMSLLRGSCEWCPLSSTFSYCNATISSACLCYIFLTSSLRTWMASPWSSLIWGEGTWTGCGCLVDGCRGGCVSAIDQVVATMLFLGNWKI